MASSLVLVLKLTSSICASSSARNQFLYKGSASQDI